MRRVRPTLRVLRELPADTYNSPKDAEAVQGNCWNDLCLYDLGHPLLEDAASFIDEGGLPQPHRSSTESAKRPVYEVRSRSGAAWRGAVVMDESSDPWLVYVNRHDQFHHRAKSYLKASNAGTYMPSTIDYKLRAREEARTADLDWQSRVLEAFIDTVKVASESGAGGAESILPLKPGMVGEYRLRISLSHDDAAESAETSHQSSTLVSLSLWLSPGTEGEELYRLVQILVPFLKVQDADSIAPVYDTQGRLLIMAVISQAKIIQLVSSSDLPGRRPETNVWPAPTHLHYVGARFLSEAFVTGKEVRAVCGEWFVPTRDEGGESALPICPKCERDKPTAEYVLDLIRQS